MRQSRLDGLTLLAGTENGMSDQPDFSALAHQLIAATKRDPARGIPLLVRKLPDVVDQIQRDAVRRGPLSFWGRSRNVDELEGVTIVDPCILQLIAAVARLHMSPITPHAGLQHTYGYLFSTIETPYGFKRDRWVETEIESAFGLNLTTLGPQPDTGTLLANATWLSGQIAFRGSPSRLNRLHEFLTQKVSPKGLMGTHHVIDRRHLGQCTVASSGCDRTEWQFAEVL